MITIKIQEVDYYSYKTNEGGIINYITSINKI